MSLHRLEKVTIFVTRKQGAELLLIKHPFAGIQLPAGTVEAGEAHRDAAWREMCEESGLQPAGSPGDLEHLGSVEQRLPPGTRAMVRTATAYARPDPESFDWATIRNGILVTLEEEREIFSRVTFREWDDLRDPQYITYQITGWVENVALTDRQRRHFYYFTFETETPPQWEVAVDRHRFTLFWAARAALPALQPPQDEWLRWLPA